MGDFEERVDRARRMQVKRFRGAHLFSNAHMSHRDVEKFCLPQPEAKQLLRSAISELGLSARAYHRVLKISRTIADLEKKEKVLTSHVSEALQYRCLDRELWRR